MMIKSYQIHSTIPGMHPHHALFGYSFPMMSQYIPLSFDGFRLLLKNQMSRSAPGFSTSSKKNIKKSLPPHKIQIYGTNHPHCIHILGKKSSLFIVNPTMNFTGSIACNLPVTSLSSNISLPTFTENHHTSKRIREWKHHTPSPNVSRFIFHPCLMLCAMLLGNHSHLPRDSSDSITH